MNLYTSILFVHAVAVLLITAALTMESWILFELRRIATPADARGLVRIVPLIGMTAIGSLVIIYVTGAYLTESLHSWQSAWPRLAVAEIVLYALFGALSGTRLRTINRYSTKANTTQSEWQAMARNSFLKISLSTRIWIVMGTILLTAAKPPLKGSLMVVAGSLVFGLACSRVSLGRRPCRLDYASQLAIMLESVLKWPNTVECRSGQQKIGHSSWNRTEFPEAVFCSGFDR